MAAIFLTGCAAFQGQRKTTSLPIEAVNSHSSTIANVRTVKNDAHLYVTGIVRQHRGYPLLSGAHVDVQLLDRRGTLLAEISDDIDPIHPRHASARGGHYPFCAGFPAEIAREASKIRILSRANDRSTIK